MAAFFSRILNMSLTGSVVIGIVLVARFLLKRSPKIYSYALWAVVLFRLLCPISFSAPISMLNLVQPEVTVASERTSVVSFVPTVQTLADTEPEFQQMAPIVETQPKTLETKDVISIIWLVGVGAMVACSVVQYLCLRKRLVGDMLYRDNVYLSDYIESPFVMGIISPKIYMPSAIPTQERKYILAHERHHIRRGDPVWKLLGYAALCIHWFNPLVWAAFILAGKDMEMSCDEAVIRKFGPEIRADYSASLLRLATHRNTIAGMPLAFGEGDTKGRVMNMAKWKKPKVWISILCAVACILVITACAVNPEKVGTIGDPNSDGPTATFNTSNEDFDLRKTRLDGPVKAGWEDFHFLVPEGMAIQDDTIGSAFYVGDTVVGGVVLRNQPDENVIDDSSDFTSFGSEWQQAIGVPEASDDSMGNMGGDSLYGDWEVTYFLDIPLNYDESGNIIPDENGKRVLDSEVTHYFFLNGKYVYDIWLYNNRCDNTLQEALLESAYVEGTADSKEQAVVETSQPTAFYPDAEERLAQCKAVLDQVQSGAQALQCVRKSDYDTGIIQYWKNEGDWMTIQNHSDDSIVAYLHCGGAYYSNIAMTDDGVIGARDDNGMVLWEECDKPESFHIPWLSRYAWNDEAVEYLGTENKDGQSRIRLHIREPFPGYESGTPYYDVTMVFGDSGAFLQAELEVNQGLGGFFTETETISSLDGSVVADKIQQEYQRSIG